MKTASALISMLLACSIMHAQVDIVVDFGGSNGLTGGYANDIVPDSGGGAFSSMSATELTSYTDGSDTGVFLSISTSGGNFYSDWPTDGGGGAVWQGSDAGWLADSLTGDYIGSSSQGASMTVTITGLAEGTYTVSVLSSGDYVNFAAVVSRLLRTFN
jgi:hypothetical protein